MHKSRFFYCGVLLALLASGCTTSPPGIVYDQQGNLAPYTTIEFFTADDTGTPLAVLGYKISDSNGHFDTAGFPRSSPTLLAKAIFPNYSLRGFATGDGTQLTIHPLTEALVANIVDITETDGELSLLDLSSALLQQLTRSALSLDPDLSALNTSTLLLQFVRNAIGREIAEGAHATITAATSASIDPANSLLTGQAFTAPSGSCLSSQFFPLSGLAYTFDITPEGEICDAPSNISNNTFDEAFRASISNDTYDNSGDSDFPLQATITTQDDNTVVMGPEATSNLIQHTRKIYVNPQDNIVRYLELLTNQDSVAHEVDLVIRGDLGANDATTLLVRGEEDAALLQSSDKFAAAISALVSNTATVGFVWQDNNGIDASSILFHAGSQDVFEFSWSNLSLAAGQSKAILYYTWVDPSRNADYLRAQLRSISENPDMQSLLGTELQALINFAPNLGNVVGSAGVAVAGSNITITNLRTSSSTQTSAKSDWSFTAYIEALSGDTIHIQGDDGLEQTITVP